jgi:hypothetical protein
MIPLTDIVQCEQCRYQFEVELVEKVEGPCCENPTLSQFDCTLASLDQPVCKCPNECDCIDRPCTCDTECQCCRICRHVSTKRVNDKALDQMLTARIELTEFDICRICKNQVYYALFHIGSVDGGLTNFFVYRTDSSLRRLHETVIAEIEEH